MAEMTMIEAVEKLREIIPDESAVLIDDGARLWSPSNLVDEIRIHDDGIIPDLAVSEDGIVRVRPDGTQESTHLYRVRPQPTRVIVDLSILDRAIAYYEDREGWQRAAGNTSAAQYYRGLAEALRTVRDGSFEPR